MKHVALRMLVLLPVLGLAALPGCSRSSAKAVAAQKAQAAEKSREAAEVQASARAEADQAAADARRFEAERRAAADKAAEEAIKAAPIESNSPPPPANFVRAHCNICSCRAFAGNGDYCTRPSCHHSRKDHQSQIKTK